MNETLGQKQRRFASMVGRLICTIYDMGYECTFGDAFRDPRVHGEFGSPGAYGRRSSLHKQRLAVDLNLFKDGRYLTATEDYEPIGKVWEEMGGSWGGRFQDGNHFSLAHGGFR